MTSLNFLIESAWGNILIGYFFGSIPFGLILCAACGYGDIRKIGSGNIGATNVLRTGNKLLALLTMILDSSKGAAGFILSYWITGSSMLATIAAFSAVLGHMFPLWLKFKGGKGVATTFGAMLAATPITAGIAALTWLLSALFTRLSSLAALSAALLAPVVSYIFYGTEVALLNGFISALVWLRHKDNIKRLMNGEEPKIGEKKKNKTEQENNESTASS